jgi:hypothetical protein
MAVGKFGPASAFFLVDGYNILSNKITALREKAVSLMSDGTGLGDSAYETFPVGRVSSEVVQEGGYWDTSTNYSHTAYNNLPANPQSSARVICLGFAGQTTGYPTVGYEGAFSDSYEVLAEMGDLTKANATYSITGKRSAGVILQPLAAKTADWNTQSSSVDNSSSSSNGGEGFLQCTAATGFSAFVGTIQHSADDTSFASLIDFTDNVSAPFAERKTVSGTVNRYLAFSGNVTGSGSITVFASFARA